MLDLKVSYPSLKCAQLKEITIKHSLFHSTAVVRMQPMKMYFLLSSLPMVNYSSCVWVGMVLIEDGRRKSVSFQWDSMLFLWFFEQQEGTSKYHLLVAALLLRSPGVTEEVNLWEQSQVTCTDGVYYKVVNEQEWASSSSQNSVLGLGIYSMLLPFSLV